MGVVRSGKGREGEGGVWSGGGGALRCVGSEAFEGSIFESLDQSLVAD